MAGGAVYDEPVTYTVEGEGEFPLAMLDRDFAKAATPEDQIQINARCEESSDLLFRTRRVTLVAEMLRHAPTTARWESFGWRVVEASSPLAMLSAAKVGRPRVYPEGTTAADRVRRSLQDLVEAGGARKTFRLSPRAVANLEAIREAESLPTDTGTVEHALEVTRQNLRGRRR